MPPRKPVRYKDAGVDIDEADRAVAQIKKLAQDTMTRNVLTGIGSFGAGFELSGFKKPVLVSSADGVGTKLKLAFMTGRHDTIGEDLVNHCVNDIAVQGARPLFFLDYFAVGKLDALVAEQVVEGIARGCKANKCALIGGETAEMPGFYAAGEYDLAGFIVGAVEKNRLLTGAKIKAGDVLLGPALDWPAYERLLARAKVAVRSRCAQTRHISEGNRRHRGGRSSARPPQLSQTDTGADEGRPPEGRCSHHGRWNYGEYSSNVCQRDWPLKSSGDPGRCSRFLSSFAKSATFRMTITAGASISESE